MLKSLVATLKKLFGPKSKFSVGDTVQLRDGKYLMRVIEVCSERGMKSPLIHCEWYEGRVRRCNLIKEEELFFIDWSRVNM